MRRSIAVDPDQVQPRKYVIAEENQVTCKVQYAGGFTAQEDGIPGESDEPIGKHKRGALLGAVGEVGRREEADTAKYVDWNGEVLCLQAGEPDAIDDGWQERRNA